MNEPNRREVNMQASQLADELDQLETETFEIEDHAELGGDMASCSSSSCCVSCTSCGSCSS
jgi:thiazolylpeptide-type bacteriocin precursor